MSLQNISRDILSKAQNETKQINEELEDLMSNLESESQNQLEEYKQSLKQKYDSEFKASSQKILGKYSRESKKLLLDTKSDILSQTYEKIIEKINSLSQKEKEKILSKLIVKAQKYIDYDTIYCSKEDEKFVSQKSRKSKIKTKPIQGLIFEANRGREKLDLTFEVLINEIFENSTSELQKILFN